ncbi:Uncharacterised protein [Halioglobus japonicus]|nr:Uncharacterised protein [Halioglobus japonicus]
MRILPLTVLACFSNFIWADTPDNYQQEIQEVEAHAKLLLEKIKSKDKYELEALNNYRELENSLSAIECPNYSYTAYTIEHGGESLLYLVAANSISRSVIIGRHFVTKIDGGVADTLNIASSTNGCIDLGEPKEDAAAMYVTSLDPYPNEFHVVQSQLNTIPLYVGTSYATWLVSDGRVSLVKLHKDA